MVAVTGLSDGSTWEPVRQLRATRSGLAVVPVIDSSSAEAYANTLQAGAHSVFGERRQQRNCRRS